MDQYYINATTLDTSVIAGDAINWTESMTPVTANIYLFPFHFSDPPIISSNLWISEALAPSLILQVWYFLKKSRILYAFSHHIMQ